MYCVYRYTQGDAPDATVQEQVYAPGLIGCFSYDEQETLDAFYNDCPDAGRLCSYRGQNQCEMLKTSQKYISVKSCNERCERYFVMTAVDCICIGDLSALTDKSICTQHDGVLDFGAIIGDAVQSRITQQYGSFVGDTVGEAAAWAVEGIVDSQIDEIELPKDKIYVKSLTLCFYEFGESELYNIYW